MDVARWVTDRGGVARAADARRAGATSRDITAAVVSGLLARPRRGWLALPGLDAALLAAARAGVVLSCVSEAKRLGLWTFAVDRPHVAAPSHAGAVRVETDDDGARKAVVHWATPVIARAPDAVRDPIENVLALVAACQPFEKALVVWESALRKGLVDRGQLERLPLRHRARAVLAAASPFSDSGLETLVIPRLAWLRLPIRQQSWILGHRVDFLIGDRLVLQIDGGTHVGPQRVADIRHDAQLMLAGYHVIRVGYHQVVNDWPAVQELIMRAVAQGLHLAR